MTPREHWKAAWRASRVNARAPFAANANVSLHWRDNRDRYDYLLVERMHALRYMRHRKAQNDWHTRRLPLP